MKRIIAGIFVLSFIGVLWAEIAYKLDSGEIVEYNAGRIDRSKFPDSEFGFADVYLDGDRRRKLYDRADGLVKDLSRSDLNLINNGEVHEQIISLKEKRFVLALVLGAESDVAIGNLITKKIASIDVQILILQSQIR